MPNPSPLHDPLAKIFFPGAPIVPQLRKAAKRDKEDGNGWPGLLDAAANLIEQDKKLLASLEELLKGVEGVEYSSQGVILSKGYPYVWWHASQHCWWLSTGKGSKAIGTLRQAMKALEEEKCRLSESESKNPEETTSRPETKLARYPA